MRKRYIVATSIYCLFIWLLSAESRPETLQLPLLFPGMDKLCHMVLYAGLAALVSVGIHRSGRPVSPWSQCFVPILFATFYGATDEIHQLFIPFRHCDISDLIADMAGATAIQAVLCYMWWRGRPETAAPGH